MVWRMPSHNNAVYLSFDDGPIPQVTSWVLDTLSDYEAKATFFCVGENVKKYPDLYHRILTAGHATGNHTHSHFNGWKHTTRQYLKNVAACAALVKSDLFRPPYGKITRKQYHVIRERYRVIMWDVLSGDFDKNTSKEKCLKNVLSKTRSGSIIVFHDSLKAWKNLHYTLPRALKHFKESGYTFEAL